nr:MAG TPA: hypothetical protein [Caudoviricetes sp.]
MDFDTEIAKFLGTAQMKQSIYKFAVKAMKGQAPGTALAMSDAEVWAKKARDEIVASLPDVLKNSPYHAITSDDLFVYPGEVTDDGKFRFNLAWNPYAVHRNSLYVEGYPDGIADIVALFHTGYTTKNYAYGYWDNHQAFAWDPRNAPDATGDFMWTRSLRNRPASSFLTDAIATFNAAHKADGVVVELLPNAKYYH